MIKFINKLVILARGWRVTIVWEDTVITHVASSFNDALDWCKQYPLGICFEIHQHSKLIASR